MEDNLRQRLSKEAFARFGNIRAANPSQAVEVLVAMTKYLSKKQGMVGDQEFRELLQSMFPKGRRTTIRRM
jgi:DNA-binding TFAR19-related protein (PDSD5 family)